MKRILIGLSLLGIAVAQQGASPSENAQLVATAQLMNAGGEVIGDVNFTVPTEGDETFVTVQVGLEPGADIAPGAYGFHIHETGACEPDFGAAGGHFDPTGASHGFLDTEGPHAGDLPNVTVEADGTVSYVASTTRVIVEEGEASLFDADGSAVILHAQPDNYLTNPGGDSGDRIACGVIEME